MITRERPTAVVIRSVAGVLSVVLCVGGALLGALVESLRTDVLKVQVLAISPDGRFEVVRLITKDWKNSTGTDLRLRSHAGLLSRESPLQQLGCSYDPAGPDLPRAEFVDSRSIRVVGAGGTSVTVTFDAETMKPDRYAEVC